MAHPNALPLPIDASNEPDAQECLRAWAVKDGLQVIVNTVAFHDPAAWGVVLADLIEHVSAAYDTDYGLDPQKTRFKILAMFAEEMEAPTTEREGELIN